MKIKVLIIQEVLVNYRDPIYKLINQNVDLTVAYTTSTNYKQSTYPIIHLPYIKIGSIIWHKSFRRIINNYDVVIFVPHFRMIRLALLPFVPHKPKLVTWSLGVHASRSRLYDLNRKPDWEDKLFECIQDHADASVFYMPEPIEYWKKYKRIDEQKYFVAHNTVAVNPYDELETKNRKIILFIGTLYKQKGIGELLECYAEAIKRVGKLPQLIIIGKGPEQEIISNQVKELHLENQVELTGPIYEEIKLKNYFVKALICVSPKQAGLSVLKSFGYGVPFVTRKDAITGGEKANIINGKNGLFYESREELVDILCKTVTEPSFFNSMSVEAKNYYQTFATPPIMAQGVLNAITYVINKPSKK